MWQLRTHSDSFCIDKKKCIHLNVQDCPPSDSSRSFLILLEKEQAKI